MSLINLLPVERSRALTRDYYLRLMVVSLVMVGLLALAASALLLPVRVYLTDMIATKQTVLDRHVEPTPREPRMAEREAALTTRIAMLRPLTQMPSASGVVRDALRVARSGIRVFNINYAPAGATKAGTLMISGSANSREALRAYQEALQAAPFAATVDLPVSAYAKDANIPFTMTVTMRP